MLQPQRQYNLSSGYRYGFNGKENDNEIKGTGNQQDYGMRIYDTRIGRFLSNDPLTKSYPMLTPYQFGTNNPIAMIDIDGMEGSMSISGSNLGGSALLHVEFDTDGDHIPNYDKGWAGGALGTFTLGAVVLTAGRAAPILKEVGIGALLWGSKPENQQKVAAAGYIVAEFFNPNPEPLNPGNPSSQVGSEVKQATKKIFTTIKPLFERRKELAKGWGIAEKYIEYSKQVFTKTLNEGTELIQYRVKGSEGTIGNYYALPGTKPEAIGIKPDDVIETLNLKVKTSTDALISTHKKDMPYYKDGATKLEGGGQQIFSPDLKNNVEVVNKIKN